MRRLMCYWNHVFCVVWAGMAGLGRSVDSRGRGFARVVSQPIVRRTRPLASAPKNTAHVRGHNIVISMRGRRPHAPNNAVLRKNTRTIVDWEGSISKLPLMGTQLGNQASIESDSLGRGSTATTKTVRRALAQGVLTPADTRAGNPADAMRGLAPALGERPGAPIDNTVSLRPADHIFTYTALVGMLTLIALFSIRYQIATFRAELPHGRRKIHRTKYVVRSASSVVSPPACVLSCRSEDAVVDGSVADCVNSVVPSNECAVFIHKMWKLSHNGEPTDIKAWREVIVWISSTSHLYFDQWSGSSSSELNSIDQQRFDQSTADLHITELSPESNFFEHAVRLASPVDGKEVVLATANKRVMEMFLDTCGGNI